MSYSETFASIQLTGGHDCNSAFPDLLTKGGARIKKNLRVGGIATIDTLRVRSSGIVEGDLHVVGTITSNTSRDLVPNTAVETRRLLAYQKRVAAAYNQFVRPLPDQEPNDDETSLSPLYIGQFSKGMNHNNLGEVDAADYESLLLATITGNPLDYDAIPTGNAWIRYHSPQAANAFDLEGSDTHSIAMIPAPGFSTAWRAGECVENYWMAIMRDVNFEDYGTNANTDVRAGYPAGVTAAALADLNALSDFRGPKSVGGLVTAETLFRGKFGGNLLGPYISQFLYLDCPFGSTDIDQKMHVPTTGVNFMTTFNEWLSIQRGNAPSGVLTLDPTKRYIRNARDMGQFCRMDVLYQAYFQAMLVMGSLGVPVNAGNPYKTSTNQTGFATFGGPHIAALLAEVCSRAIKAAWYNKWNVHRTLRPEAFAGRVHQTKVGNASYPIHPDVLNSDAASRVFAANGTWLMPMAYPEGCPPHPSYAAGHATVSSACVTILKAWFDCSGIIAAPMKPNAAGTALVAYVGPALTIEGELNKISANVGIGRNLASVHWRSDYDESVYLGEEIAISVLRDQQKLFGENFGGFTFNTFSGVRTTV